jgi:hypothetical protein
MGAGGTRHREEHMVGIGAWGQAARGIERNTWWAWGHALPAWRMPHRIQSNRMLNGMSPLLVQRYYCRAGLFGSECGLSMQLVCWSVSSLPNPNRGELAQFLY